MELIRPDFKVVNQQNVFTSDELQYIDASVNGFPLPTKDKSIVVSIKRKVGVKSWPHAIAMLFKLNVVQCLCLLLAAVSFSESIAGAVDFQRVNFRTPTYARTRTRRELEA